MMAPLTLRNKMSVLLLILCPCLTLSASAFRTELLRLIQQ